MPVLHNWVEGFSEVEKTLYYKSSTKIILISE